jgi:hypothetical protein
MIGAKDKDKDMDELVVVKLTPQKQSDGSIVFSWNDRGQTKLGALSFGTRPHRDAQRILAAWKPKEHRITHHLAAAPRPRPDGPAAVPGVVPGLAPRAPAGLELPTLKITRRQAENGCNTYARQVQTQRKG